MAKSDLRFPAQSLAQWIGGDVCFPGNTLAFAHSWASLWTQCRHPTSRNCCSQHRAVLLLQRQRDAAPAKSRQASPRKGALPKTGKSRGLPLMCRERNSQEQWVSAHSLVGRTSCSASGSCAALCSVWISKFFDYSSVSGAEGENFIILGSLFSDCD